MSTLAKTPRTDAVEEEHYNAWFGVSDPLGSKTALIKRLGEFARQLERELTALRTAHEAAQSKLRALIEAHSNLRADYTKVRGECNGLRKSELRWKRMAEFQYGKRAYPDHIELAQGALDAYFKLDFDGKDAIDAARKA